MVPIKENTTIYNLADDARKKIGKLDEAKLEILIDDSMEKFERREQEDLALCVSDKGLRYVNHMSRFYFEEKRHICNIVSLTLKPGKCVCDDCGKFQQGEHTSSVKILNAYFEASEEDQKEFLRVLSHFYKDNRRVPL